ncbi:hypothetical protein ACFE04_006317 [Oxalis oulophora]
MDEVEVDLSNPQNQVSLSIDQTNLQLGSSLHASINKNHEFFNPVDQFIQKESLFIWNSLLSMYAKSGNLTDAVKLFDEMPVRDTVSWNTMISGFVKNGDIDKGFGFLKSLRESGFSGLDQATLTTVMSALDRPELVYSTGMVHGLVILTGYCREITVGNALITSYFKCCCSKSGRQVFDEMLERNVITWTAVVSGLAQSQHYVDSLVLFQEMRSNGMVSPNLLTYLSLLTSCSGLQALLEGCQVHGVLWKLGFQSDLCIESALMDMYSKCGNFEDAWKIFESAEKLDEVSLTVILASFAQNGSEEEAMQIFIKIVKSGIKIDPNMISAILSVFGSGTSLGFGKQIHSLVIKRKFICNPFVTNGLINMYSKCGELGDSIKIFRRTGQKNVVSWNSMIAAFARHGDASRALKLYEQMTLEGVTPTDVTFLSLLHACSHVGLVHKGMEFLQTMIEVYKMEPRTEHYSCVVDMLGRAGLLSEAKKLIEGLEIKPDVLIWQALLGACSFYGDPEMGKYAADQLLLTTPESAAAYILLANIYSSKGKWKERAKTIKRMKEMGVAKETGISWIEIGKKVHSFVVMDRMHPETESIYQVLAELFRFSVEEGYVPDKRFVLCYFNQDGKEQPVS